MSEHDRPDRQCYRGLYGQERSSDVEFEVGTEGSTWRLTAHKRVLAASSPVMKSHFYGPMSPQSRRNTVRVDDVDPRAFQCLLRYMYGLPPQLHTVFTGIATLYAAHKYLCSGLEWECAAFLNEQIQLKADSVLEILQAVSFFCQRGNCEPTAPPAEDLDSDSEASQLVGSRRNSGASARHVSPRRASVPEPPIGEACMRLRHNCLQVVDHNADFVLPREQVEDLDRDTLLAVMSRDTLAVTNEMTVFRAAERWAECECKRKKLPYTSQHLRDVLGGEHVVCGGQLARLLLLTPQEFADGPARSPLLSSEEQKSLLVHLVACSEVMTSQQGGSPHHISWSKLSCPRSSSPAQYLAIPSSLSCLEAPCEAPRAAKSRRWGLRWPRSKRKRSKPEIVKQEKPGCCARTCEFFLTVIACLFD